MRTRTPPSSSFGSSNSSLPSTIFELRIRGWRRSRRRFWSWGRRRSRSYRDPSCLRPHRSYDGRTMRSRVISSGVVHTVPMDLRRVLTASPKTLAAWENLTPLARNEWICWVLWPKKAETRSKHIQRVRSELLEGKRRPCCWLGCTHRTDKELSPSVRWVMGRRSKASA